MNVVTLERFFDGCDLGNGIGLPPLSLPGTGRIVLSDRQREIVRQMSEVDPETGLPRHRVVCLSLPKGGGKTMILGAEALRVLLTVPSSRSVLLGPSERGARFTLYDMIRDLAKASYPWLPLGKMLLENGSIDSQIVVTPASEATAQGLRPRAGEVTWGSGGSAFVDEAHSFDFDPTGQASSTVGGAAHLLIGQCEAPHVTAYLCGMLGATGGLMCSYKDLADSGDADHIRFIYEGGDAEALLRLNPMIGPAWIEGRRKELLPALFDCHIQNLPASASSGVFEPAWIEGAKERGRELGLSSPITADEWARLKSMHDQFAVAVGLDRAMGLRREHDRTCLTFLARPLHGGPAGASPVYLLASHTFDVGESSADEILGMMETFRRRYGPVTAFAADVYQALDLASMAKRVLRVGKSNVHLAHETSGLQLTMFQGLGGWFRDGRFVMGEGPDSDNLGRELLNLRAKLTSSLDGARFEASRGRDDAAHSCGLASLALGRSRREYIGTGPASWARTERSMAEEYKAAHGEPMPERWRLLARELDRPIKVRGD